MEEPVEESWRKLAGVARSLIEAIPHARALGLKLTKVERAKAWGEAPFREDLVGDPEAGVISGGVIIALLDNLCGVATVAALETPANVATLDLRIDYMRPAAPGAGIQAVAHCHTVRRSVAFVRAVAFDRDETDPVAQATATFMVRAPSRRSRKARS